MADHVLISEGVLIREDGPRIDASELTGVATQTELDAVEDAAMPLAGGTFSDDVTFADGVNIVVATTAAGTTIGTASGELLAFHGATPVDQAAFVADATGGTTVDTEVRTVVASILDVLIEKGLMAAS